MTKLQPSLFDGLPPVLPSPLRRHPLYCVWSNMVQRCHNPKASGFKDYGGRGIYVADEWRNSSRAFIAWAINAGWQPGLQIDRRDNDGPYSPANCRFVSRLANANNKRNTVRLSDGTAFQDVARRLGVNADTLHMRVHRGMSPDAAAARPLLLPGEHARRHFLCDGTALVDAVLPVGLNAHAVRARLSRGWSLDAAVSVPKGRKRPLPDGFQSVGDAAASVVAATVAIAQGDEAQRKGSRDE